MAEDKIFDFEKYDTPAIGPLGDFPSSFVDFTDVYANNGFNISFFHLPTGKSVYFKAFITAFNDTYSPDWAAETVYGRADPIYTFKNTSRRISLAFKVPASSAGEAYDNLARVQTLVQFLYPSYTDINSATTISQSPLVRLKVMNLAQKAAATATSTDSAASIYTSYASSSDSESGLLGVLNNVTVNHNLENPDAGVIEREGGTILPKLIEINLDFSPIHEHTVGWEHSGSVSTFGDAGFPYSALRLEDIDEEAANAGAWNMEEDFADTDALLAANDPQTQNALEEGTPAGTDAALDSQEAAASGLVGTYTDEELMAIYESW